MNILIFNWRDIKNPEAGGAEVFTHEIARRLVEKKHHLTVLTSGFKGCAGEEIVDGVKIIRRGNKFTTYIACAIYYLNHLANDFEVIIDEINGNFPWFIPLYARNKPLVIALRHQIEFDGFGEYQSSVLAHEVNPITGHLLNYFELFYLLLYRALGVKFLTVSKSSKAALMKLGFKPEMVKVLYNSVGFKPLNDVPMKEPNPVIIYVGRLTKAKRVDHAIRAYDLIRAKHPNTALWIVGQGYFRDQLEKMAGNGVTFLGYVSEIKKRALLGKAWVLVYPSVREGFGISVIEANAMGTPCVAYDVPGLRDSVQNGSTGLLAKSGKVNSLAKEILKVLENEELRQRLSNNALQYSRTFSWDKTARDLIGFFQN